MIGGGEHFSDPKSIASKNVVRASEVRALGIVDREDLSTTTVASASCCPSSPPKKSTCLGSTKHV